MEFRPIWASLRRHRIPAALIVLEIALACAVLCNAIFMITQRVQAMHLDNAIDQSGLVMVKLNGANPETVAGDIPRNLQALRGIDGVKAVSVVSTIPLSRNNWGWMFGTAPGLGILDKRNLNASMYFVGPGADKALGLRLLKGRFFNEAELAGSSRHDSPLADTHAVVITRTLAQRMWPDESALGKVMYTKGHSYTVIGIIADVLRPTVNITSNARAYFATFFPLQPDPALNNYVIRTARADRDRVLRAATGMLSRLNPDAVAKGHTYQEIRDTYYARMASMVWTLLLVCVVMVAVTAFGIVGLTSFWVGQRRQQIGIRRAVGASRGQIMRYFQTENFLISSVGVVLGMALAYGTNLFLLHHYEMARMPWVFLPIGAIALWVIGQLAVLGPALRASRVPPVVATRSV